MRLDSITQIRSSNVAPCHLSLPYGVAMPSRLPVAGNGCDDGLRHKRRPPPGVLCSTSAQCAKDCPIQATTQQTSFEPKPFTFLFVLLCASICENVVHVFVLFLLLGGGRGIVVQDVCCVFNGLWRNVGMEGGVVGTDGVGGLCVVQWFTVNIAA